METRSEQTALSFQLDRDYLVRLADERRESYGLAKPYPHAVLDDFLPAGILDAVLEEFPSPARGEWIAFDSPTERKLASKDDAAMGPATRHLLSTLNSATFIDFLERLTGIDALIPDPHFEGGGLHQIERGGHLKVHADFNRHPRTGLERRLNVLVYLNRDWKDEYGGAFELWDRKMNRCEHKVMPYFNRCVVFSTTSTSYHGHPEPLECPEGETRKSIALYYYSKDRPPEEDNLVHNTLFHARPGEELPGAAPRRTFGQSARAAARQWTPPILVKAWRRTRHRRA
jgi:hypothetical protein